MISENIFYLKETESVFFLSLTMIMVKLRKKEFGEDFFQKKLRRIKGDFFKIKVFCLPRI